MRKSLGRKTARMAMMAGALLLSAAAQATQVQVVGATKPAGQTAPVTVSLVSGGAQVVGVENAIKFDPAAPFGKKPVSTTLAQAITATDLAVPVVDASAFPDFGTVVIENETIQFGRVDSGNILVVGGCIGVPEGASASLSCKENSECGGGTCAPLNRGQNCPGGGACAAAAHASGTAVSFPSPLPDCTRNASLGDVRMSFTFTEMACFTAPACTTPPNCPARPTCPCNVPGQESPVQGLPTCDGIAAIVVKMSNLNVPIPDGTLYTCNLPVPPDAQNGTIYNLPCEEAMASTPDGTRIEGTTCTADAKVTVGAGCAGDCDGKNGVSLSEIQTGILIKKGSKLVSTCTAMDGDGNGTVSLSEIQKAILAKKNRCGL